MHPFSNFQSIRYKKIKWGWLRFGGGAGYLGGSAVRWSVFNYRAIWSRDSRAWCAAGWVRTKRAPWRSECDRRLVEPAALWCCFADYTQMMIARPGVYRSLHGSIPVGTSTLCYYCSDRFLYKTSWNSIEI